MHGQGEVIQRSIEFLCIENRRFSLSNTEKRKRVCIFFFFCGGQDSNPIPFIYYVLFLSIELSSRGHVYVY